MHVEASFKAKGEPAPFAQFAGLFLQMPEKSTLKTR
jgi:hypothetical protein